MRFLLAIAVLLEFGSQSLAYDAAHYQILTPPARYATGPTKYPVHLNYTAGKELRAVCQMNSFVYACSTLNSQSSTCEIYLRDFYAPDLLALVMAHEMAHCRGWGADHPD